MQHELRTVAIDLAKKVFHLVGTFTGRFCVGGRAMLSCLLLPSCPRQY